MYHSLYISLPGINRRRPLQGAQRSSTSCLGRGALWANVRVAPTMDRYRGAWWSELGGVSPAFGAAQDLPSNGHGWSFSKSFRPASSKIPDADDANIADRDVRSHSGRCFSN